MANEAYENIPDPDFSPKGRRLEYALVKEAKKAIIESNEFSYQEKLKIIKFWDNYLLDYEHLYNQKREEEFFEDLEKNLRETDILKKDNFVNQSWRRYNIRKEFKKQRMLN